MESFFSYLRSAPGEESIHAERVFLRPPKVADYEAWAELRAASREFLQPWEPTWPEDDLTLAAYRRRLRGYWRDMRSGLALPLFLFHADTHELLGGITLSGIRRGIAQAASMGYWIGARHARKGYMTEAVRAVVLHAFRGMRLHRVEAACIPENEPSRRLLLRCGFTQEGYARKYLRINGQWRDHLLFAILREDVLPGSGPGEDA